MIRIIHFFQHKRGQAIVRKLRMPVPFCVIAIGLTLLLLPRPAPAVSDLPVEHLRYPVLVTLDTGQSASGFYIHNEGGDVYFVTSRHIFFGPKEWKKDTAPLGEKALLTSQAFESEHEEPIYIELRLKELLAHGFMNVHKTADVVVVKVGELIAEENRRSLSLSVGVKRLSRSPESVRGTIVGAHDEVIKKFEDVLVGNEIFIFGYPTSLGIENYPQIDYEKPLLRKGIVAGKNAEKRTIILDCPVHYGNSGGPVVEIERISLTETKIWIIGMVSEFVPFQEKQYGIRHPFAANKIENSGYSVVIPMDTILELMREKAASGEKR